MHFAILSTTAMLQDVSGTSTLEQIHINVRIRKTHFTPVRQAFLKNYQGFKIHIEKMPTVMKPVVQKQRQMPVWKQQPWHLVASTTVFSHADCLVFSGSKCS